MKTGLMTHREGFCTGTAKSVSRYDIYLEWITVYRYIGTPSWDYLVLNGTKVFTSSTKRFHLIPIIGHGRNYMDVLN